jgi:peptidoglycan/LPS O-acetylase OafA/YrhL
MSSDGNTMKMNKSARVLIVILAAGLVAGIAGLVEHGWQHPGDTIGAAVWLLVAMLFVLAIRHKSPRRP